MVLIHLSEGHIILKPKSKEMLNELYEIIEKHFDEECTDLNQEYAVQFRISKAVEEPHDGETVQ